MKRLFFLAVFLFLIAPMAKSDNITLNATFNQTVNATIDLAYLPCATARCTIIHGFIADFQPIGGTKFMTLNGIVIKVEPYSAATLNESGYYVNYKLPYSYEINESFIALPMGIALGLDQERMNVLESENSGLKMWMLFWQISAILMGLYIAGSWIYNEWNTYREE